MRVFISGATGLVGSHVAALLRARGDGVVALVREQSETGFLREIGAELVRGDVGTAAVALAEAIRGCDAVVHAAALVYGGASADDMHRVNVGGTEAVLAAARLAGVPRVLHVSSIAVYGVIREPVAEDDWTVDRVSARNAYARSKREAELAAWRAHERGDARVTTVRPGVVYGERDRLATRIFARIARMPVLPLPGGGRTTLPVVYAGNVARGIVAALDSERTAGRAYNLSGDAGLTARLLFTAFGRGLGHTPRILSIPGSVLVGLARAGDALHRLLPGTAAFGLKRAAWLLLRDNPYAVTRAERELGWTAEAQVPAAEALRRTGEWFRTTGAT